MMKNCLCLLLSVVIITLASGQKPVPTHPLTIPFQLDHSTVTEGSSKYFARTGLKRYISGLSIEADMESPGELQKVLSTFQKEIGTTGYDLLLQNVRDGKTGKVYRYQQMYEDTPVYGAQVIIKVNRNNEVTFITHDYSPNIKLPNGLSLISQAEATRAAVEYLSSSNVLPFIKTKKYVGYFNNSFRFVYQTRLHARDISGDWEIIVDAESGEVIGAEDKACYHKHHTILNNWHPPLVLPSIMTSSMVDGTGNTFDPDPLSSSGQAYGGNYVDNNDAANAQLINEQVSVSLLDISTINGGNFILRGPYAHIVDEDQPFKGLFDQASSSWNVNRDDDAFEAVTCYYHVDASMRYINNTLGLSIMPTQYTDGVHFDPHGSNGADNSFYRGSTGLISFGEGGVDDGEDSDVIHHELGHGLHDWVTNENLSQVEGLSEGCGDYWCASYNRHLGLWDPTDDAYFFTFNWDGHNEFWGGRSVNHRPGYPGGLGGQIHTDGQIWATCMMDVWDAVGREETDFIFWEGLGMTGSSTNQDDAANAVYQAAIDANYSNTQLGLINQALSDCGYDLPAPPGPPTADFESDVQVVCDADAQVVQFTDMSSGVPTSWNWSFPGGSPSQSFDQNPSVVYTTAGTYDVTLTATNGDGSDTETKTGYITVETGAACPDCIVTKSTDVPLTLSTSGTPTINSNLSVTKSGIITEINVVDLEGNHTWLGDLDFQLISPQGTQVEIISRKCGSQDDFNLDLSDAATESIQCPYNDGSEFLPDNALSAFNNEYSYGDWTLQINDNANQDGGTLQGWGLEICTQCNIPTSIPQTAGTYTADYECTDSDGWTHYMDSRGTKSLDDDLLLLSIEKQGVILGTIGDNALSVSVTLENDYNTGSGIDLSTAGYVTDPVGWWVTNRWYDVDPNGEGEGGQITDNVNVRFYYDDADIADLNGSLSSAGGQSVSASDATIYKINAEPPSPTLATHNPLVYDESYFEYIPGGSPSLTTYVYADHLTAGLESGMHRAEYTVNSFSGGGGGAGGSSQGALPVRYGDITLQRADDYLELSWTVLSEINNKGYYVEYQINNQEEWISHEFKAGGEISYQSLIPLKYSGIYYVRLRQVDTDGTVSYSPILSYSYLNKKISIQPSLVDRQFEVSGAGSDVSIIMYDGLGNRFVPERLAGNAFRFDGAPGVYYIAITVGAGETIVEKIVKL